MMSSGGEGTVLARRGPGELVVAGEGCGRVGEWWLC